MKVRTFMSRVMELDMAWIRMMFLPQPHGTEDIKPSLAVTVLCNTRDKRVTPTTPSMDFPKDRSESLPAFQVDSSVWSVHFSPIWSHLILVHLILNIQKKLNEPSEISRNWVPCPGEQRKSLVEIGPNALFKTSWSGCCSTLAVDLEFEQGNRGNVTLIGTSKSIADRKSGCLR